jgi:hypothetical protein
MIRIDAIWLATEPMDMRAGTNVNWFSTYRVHLRVTDQFSLGG